ncbi:MAG: hypothetical protein Q7T26_03430 [Dehalococcoidia bacterium]|nr:hypothetical protein [Dehalococcoidia bacterium]
MRDLARERKLDWVLGQEAASAAPGERWLNDNLPQLRQWAERLLSDLARVRLEALGPVATDAKGLQAVQSLLTVQDGENQRWAARFSFETHPSYDLLLRAVPGLTAMLEECRAQAVAYRLLAHDRAFKPENWSAEKSDQLAGIRQAFDKARDQARKAIIGRLWTDAPG